MNVTVVPPSNPSPKKNGTERNLPSRIPTAAVANAIVNFIRANADENGCLTVSLSQIADNIGLDFSRVLRAKDELVNVGVLEQIPGPGKIYTYRLLKNEVPDNLVFKHKNTPVRPQVRPVEFHPADNMSRPTIPLPLGKNNAGQQIVLELTREQLEQLSEYANEFHTAYNKLFDFMEGLGVLPESK